MSIILFKKEFLNECTSLYNELESYSNGQANRNACEILNEQLKSSLKIIPITKNLNSQG